MKCGDINPETGLIFWAFDKTRKSGIQWVTPAGFASKQAAQKKRLASLHGTPKSKKYRADWQKRKRASDPFFKRKQAETVRLRGIVKLGHFSPATAEILGCNRAEFLAHIAAQFTEWMTWENYGKGPNQWQFDHIKPMATAGSKAELLPLLHFSNIRPLQSLMNWEKGHHSK